MTSVSPIAGVAPLPMAAATPQPSTSLHAVLAGGANLGGASVSSSDYGIPQVPGVNADGTTAVAAASGAPATTGVTGGGAQAVQGAATVSAEQLVPVLQQVIAVVEQLIAALQAQGVTGGGATGGAVGQCGMAGCTMDHGAGQSMQGASGAPQAPAGERDARQGEQRAREARRQESAAPAGAGTVDPSTVKDKTSTKGLSAAALRGLEEAHRFGLPLVSGKRSGGAPGSDHVHGDAIDVGTLPIGVASSSRGTPQMIAYAEHMRAAGKAGQLNVKYIILNGQIASPTNNWAWRPYTYPGKSTAELESLKRTNPGEYNRLQHNDHVHVSFT